MAHVDASAAVHDPVVVVVEGRGGRADITDEVRADGCRVEQIQEFLVELRRQSWYRRGISGERDLIGHWSQAGRWFAEERGKQLGVWVTARWVPNDAPATVTSVTRFATLSATEMATGGARVGCCEGHGFRRQWTDVKEALLLFLKQNRKNFCYGGEGVPWLGFGF